jgi:hypothetical protein
MGLKNIAQDDINRNPEIPAPNVGYTFKMATARSSGTSTDSYQTTRYHAQEDSTVHIHHTSNNLH